MNISGIAKRLRSGVYFFGATTVVVFAFLFGSSCSSSVGNDVKLLSALGSGVLSYLIVRELGYFNSLRIHPRKSDVLLVLLALPTSIFSVQTISSQVFGIGMCSNYSLLLWAPFLALLIFVCDYFGSSVLMERNRKYKVVLELLPQEQKRILEDFAALGLDHYLEFLSLNDLRKHILRAREREIALIIISRNSVSAFDAEGILVRAHLGGIPIYDLHTVSADLTGRIRLDNADQWTYILEATKQTALLRAFSRVKALSEPLVAMCLALVFFPVMFLLAVLVKLTSRGPVFYSQVRTGYLGRSFTLVKFRSMYLDAEVDGPQWASSNDRRATPIGRLMRATRLDELPQLWNVIRGEMSFFGPRPERPEIYAQLKKEIPLFAMRTIVRPGITGWAQVCAGYAASVEESVTKLEYDLYYIKYMSPRLDAIILLKTLMVFLLGAERTSRERAMPALARRGRQVPA